MQLVRILEILLNFYCFHVINNQVPDSFLLSDEVTQVSRCYRNDENWETLIYFALPFIASEFLISIMFV